MTEPIMAAFLFFLLVWLGTGVPIPSMAQPPDVGTVAQRAERVVFLDVRASTWRPRGRISFSVAPAIKTKLTAAGFRVTQDPEAPHDLILLVEYREDRGRPISINLSGTEISCLIRVNQPGGNTVLQARIHEAPSYAELVTAPYVEVVEKFQANPYFFFLGDLIRGWTEEHLDLTGALIRAVDRQYDQERHPPATTPFDTLLSPSETFPDLDQHFAGWAQENALEELGRVKDQRALSLLGKLLFHEDRQTRLRAVSALADLDAPVVPVLMVGVVHTDADTGVRRAAARVLDGLSSR